MKKKNQNNTIELNIPELLTILAWCKIAHKDENFTKLELRVRGKLLFEKTKRDVKRKTKRLESECQIVYDVGKHIEHNEWIKETFPNGEREFNLTLRELQSTRYSYINYKDHHIICRKSKKDIHSKATVRLILYGRLRKILNDEMRYKWWYIQKEVIHIDRKE